MSHFPDLQESINKIQISMHDKIRKRQFEDAFNLMKEYDSFIQSWLDANPQQSIDSVRGK